jgi:hypothetical protein
MGDRAIRSPLRFPWRPILIISPCCEVFCPAGAFFILSIAFSVFSSPSDEAVYNLTEIIRIGILHFAYVFKTLL